MNKIASIFSVLFLSLAFTACQDNFCGFKDSAAEAMKQECLAYGTGLGCMQVSGNNQFDLKQAKKDAKCDELKSEDKCSKTFGAHQVCEWK